MYNHLNLFVNYQEILESEPIVIDELLNLELPILLESLITTIEPIQYCILDITTCY